jgi:hypothetical protein
LGLRFDGLTSAADLEGRGNAQVARMKKEQHLLNLPNNLYL